MSLDVDKRAREAEEKVKSFVEDPVAVEGLAEKAREKIRKNQGSLGGVRKDLETLVRLLRAWATGKYKGISIANLLIVAGAVFYFLNPIDAVADFLPLIGFSDDVAVVLFAIRRLKGEFERFEDWEQVVDVDPKV